MEERVQNDLNLRTVYRGARRQRRRVRDASMVVLAVVWALGAAVCPASSAEPPGENWLPTEPLQGRIVFENKHCNMCHSIGGAGGDIGPDLAESAFEGTFLDLASTLWNHIPDMVVEQMALNMEWQTFDEEEIGSLISYLYYLRYLGKPGNADAGERLFEGKGCSVCHTVGVASGGDVGPKLDRLKKYASPIYVIQAIWNHGPKMQKRIRELGVERPSFVGQDINDLAAYIRSISRWTVSGRVYLSPGDPRAGRSVFENKGCSRCHSIAGRGGGIGPRLDDVDLSESVTDIAAMMWNHADAMQAAMGEESIAWPTFEGKEMADLIAFMYFINFTDPAGDVDRGEALLDEKQCLACHSIRGEGADVGPDLAEIDGISSNVSMLCAMFNHAGRMSEEVLREGKAWPMMRGSDIQDIFTYLKSIR